MDLTAILQLATAFAPTISNLILMLKHKDGSTSVIALLDQADTTLAENQKQIAEWLAAHPLTTTPQVK